MCCGYGEDAELKLLKKDVVELLMLLTVMDIYREDMTLQKKVDKLLEIALG